MQNFVPVGSSNWFKACEVGDMAILAAPSRTSRDLLSGLSSILRKGC
ncbi:hypothetical protein RTCIAT899_PB00140 (plasmid) [Rhizobium tropici CIAT 899]|nr:hypothetical protein RTCIAT899_PB00140 [Rhizobium tropici CIAT 899]